MSTYPRDREAYHAQRVIRAMTKTAAAQEIGPTAFALVALVAAQEDAKRYQSPPTYYNDQLLPLLGIAKWDTLAAARDKAVHAGWLTYQPPPSGKRGVPGVYWTSIPLIAQETQDTTCDESDILETHYRQGFEDGFKAAKEGQPYPNSGTVAGTLRGWSRGRFGDERGELPFLCPNTSSPGQAPDASTLAEPREPKPSRYSPEDVAAAEWFAVCIAKLQPTRKEIQPDRKPATVQKWADVIRLMREQDKRTHDQIRHLFERVQRDAFWRKNVLSPAKLREKWDDLALKLASGTATPSPASKPLAPPPARKATG